MTNERLAELKKMRVNIDDISNDLDNLDTKYDRWQVVGRLYGEGLSSADVLCDLDEEIVLKRNLRRLKMTERKPEYHLYLFAPPPGHGLWHALRDASTVEQVENLVAMGKDVDTLQLVTCTTDLFTKGYRIFVHPRLGDRFEITLGECERTNREIRMGHCLWRMLITGASEI